MKERTREPQYQITMENLERLGPVELGPVISHVWRTDPRRLTFLLARYKFCSKILAGKGSVFEVGCGDGFGMRVVLQEVPRVTGVDFDPLFIRWAEAHAKREKLTCEFKTVDMTKATIPGKYGGAYSLDVLEHIPKRLENRFMRNVCEPLERDGVCVIGTPNITAHAYASKPSREGHINLKSAKTLKSLMAGFFRNVFLFSMNDEVVHTGFYPMAHYLFAVGAGRR